MSENSKFGNFWAISTCNTSKERIFHIEFNFIQKKYDLFEKNLKKSNFSDFFFKTDADHLSSSANFSNFCQEISNWVHLCFGEVLKLKLIKGELIISNGLEMSDAYLLGGVAATPLLLGLRHFINNFLWYHCRNWKKMEVCRTVIRTEGQTDVKSEIVM